MDRPLWDELKNGVEDLGCGAVVVRSADGETEYKITDVKTMDDEVVIEVEWNE